MIKLLLLSMFFMSQRGLCQSTSYTRHDFADTVIVGDTARFADFSDPGLNPSGCQNYGYIDITFKNGAGFSAQTEDVLPTPLLHVFFHPNMGGHVFDTLLFRSYKYGYHCQGGNGFIAFISAVALTDSFPKIRPHGWNITMQPDSLGSYYHSFSTPIFDNPISDSTFFSNFTATPSNGTSCTLIVSDSITPITEYQALPFRRKHPLNLVFSSPNYRSFDTVIFSTRMQHGIVDSIISYALPVTWVAPLGVAQSKSLGENYALPNPFTSHTTIGLALQKAENVHVQIFDVIGREVQSVERECGEGINEFEIDGSSLPAGSYWYVARGGEWVRSGKLVKLEP